MLVSDYGTTIGYSDGEVFRSTLGSEIQLKVRVDEEDIINTLYGSYDVTLDISFIEDWLWPQQ